MSAFSEITERLTYPMLVVTTATGAERAGCLVGFWSQCSIDPPRVLLCLSDRNFSYRVASDASHLVAHVLADDQRHLAEHFGAQTGDEVDKFAGVDWEPGPGGAPVLTQAAAWFGGPILTRADFGDHTGYLIDPAEGHCRDGEWGYVDFAAVRDLPPGHGA